MGERSASADRRGGSDPGDVLAARSDNERRVLALLRVQPVARAELARLTGLTAQAMTRIARGLVADGLVRPLAPVRGRVGPPSVPLALDPRGAYALGCAVGRRGGELALVDFTGGVVARLQREWRWPEPDGVREFVASSCAELAALVPATRLRGLGVSLPSKLWQWRERLDAPAGTLDAWRDHDLAADLERATGLPLRVGNDATAACGAELSFGRGAGLGDFAYFSIGFFAGGGLVVDGTLYAGRHGRGAEFGSLPVPAHEGGGLHAQLIDEASLHVLETMLDERLLRTPARTSGGCVSPTRLTDPSLAAWTEHPEVLGRWEVRVANALATATTSVASVADLDHVVIDGPVPAPVRARLCARVRAALERLDTRGLDMPPVVEGTLGSTAASLGAARLALLDDGLPERTVAVGSVSKEVRERP